MKIFFAIGMMLLSINVFAHKDLEIIVEEIQRPPVILPEQKPDYISNCGKEACLSNDKRSVRADRKINAFTVCFTDAPGRIPGQRLPNDIEDVLGFDDNDEAFAVLDQDTLLIKYTRPITNNGYCKTWNIKSYNLKYLKVAVGHKYCTNWANWSILFTGSSTCVGSWIQYHYSNSALATYPEITSVRLDAEKN